MTGWFVFTVWIGGCSVAYERNRKRRGRVSSFFEALTWPYDVGAAIARTFYRAPE